MDQDDQNDPSQQNPALWDFIKQKLATQQGANPSPSPSDYLNSIANLKLANPQNQAAVDNGIQLAAGSVGGGENEAANASEGILPKLKSLVGAGENASTQDVLNAAAQPSSGASKDMVAAAVDANSRNMDQASRLEQAFAAKRAKALAYARQGR